MTLIRWMAYCLIFSFLMSGNWLIFGRIWGKLYSSLQVYLGISLNQGFPPHPIITSSCHFNLLKVSVICPVANTLVRALLNSQQNFNWSSGLREFPCVCAHLPNNGSFTEQPGDPSSWGTNVRMADKLVSHTEILHNLVSPHFTSFSPLSLPALSHPPPPYSRTHHITLTLISSQLPKHIAHFNYLCNYTWIVLS